MNQRQSQMAAAYSSRPSMETIFRQVKSKLQNGSAVLVFDDETETTNIFLADDPVLKKD
jgi:uncharacterized protein YheU (UPF0270 family)